MKLRELISLVDSLGYPFAFSHFDSNPGLPFITYLTPDNPDFKADNKNYHKVTDVVIELYTIGKDLIAEGKIEKLLDDNDISYQSHQVYIESEKVHQKTYEMRLI